MKEQTVILTIRYDDTQDDPPSQWDWPVLLECDPDDVDIELTGVLVSKEE